MKKPCTTVTSNGITITTGVQGPQGPGGPAGNVGNVVPVTASRAISAVENTTLYTNEGATGEVDLTLPNPTNPFVPLQFSLLVVAAQKFEFKAPAGVIITNGADSTTAGGTISSNTVNNVVTVIMVSATHWIISSIVGLWDMT